MNALRQYLNALNPRDQQALAASAGTSIGYLRKAISVGQPLSEGLCIRIERATEGRVTVEELRPDLAEHWAYIRGTAKRSRPPKGAAA